MAKTKKLTKDLAEKIRNEYVQGIDLGTTERKYQTIDSLAIKHKVARSTLYKWSQKESWKAQQERFQSEFLQKVDAQRQKEMAKNAKSLDDTALSLAKILMNEIGLQLQENNLKRQSGATPMTPQMLNQLGTASLQAQKLGKIATGESTENIKLNAEVTDTDAFREAMELLDEVARAKQQVNDSGIH
jgi:transposase-like protein|tara:strand:- start:2186 stop:2746 length:561 start_codon:yes stop_codon:yes gene_type:complete